MMVLGSMSALADTTTAHTIKVTTHGNGTHEYSAFQIFTGNLDATGKKLSNVVWGSAITDEGAALIAEIKKDSTLYTSVFADEDLTSAAKIADKLSGVANDGAVAKAFADAVAAALGNATSTTKATTDTNKQATINVTGDGYYFIKDTGTIGNEDTATRFMLQVVGNVAVNAKDTVLTPDKVILKEDNVDTNGNNGVKDNDSSIGDVINYRVTIPVPDTTQYKDHFVLEMTDTLEAGLTYLGNMVITIGNKTLTADTNYATTVKTGTADFTLPANSVAAVTTTGGQTIKVLFKEFKAYVEADQDSSTEGVQNLIGETITISYDVVLNEKATMGFDSNDNTVYFKYSNNPNHTYGGDGIPDDDKVVGKTPDSKTKTFVTTLELDKTDGATKQALAGAEFELTGYFFNGVKRGDESRDAERGLQNAR